MTRNRTAHGSKWKPESAARMLWDLGLCMHVVTAPCARADDGAVCHQGVKLVSNVRQKLWATTENVFVPLLGMQHHIVYIHVPEEEMCLARTTHGHKSKKKTKKNNPEAAKKKMLSKRTLNPLKSIDPGLMLQAARGVRQPRCPLSLGNSLHPLPKENSRSTLAVFCAHNSMPAPQRSLNLTKNFQRGTSFPMASYQLSFLPPLWLEPMVHVLSNHGW